MKLEPRKIIFFISSKARNKVLPLRQVLIIVLVVLAIGYWFWQNRSFNPVISPTPSATPAESSSEASPNETADWKVFRSEVYGYEIKYPLEWDYNTDQEDPGLYWLVHTVNTLEPYWLSLRVFDNPKKLSSKQWVEEILSENQKANEPDGPGIIRYKEARELTIAGRPAYELYGVMADDRNDEWIYLAKGDKLYYFNLPVGEENPNLSNPVENNKIGQQIISSLKFLTGEKNMPTVNIKTNLGEIKIETNDQDAPKTVENFIALVKKGFYDGLTFHRIIKGFMIQGGDPRGDGTGGPGYQFEDELNPNTESYKAGYKKGVLAMANAGPNTNGSQFFIMLEDYPLPHNYTIFGKVISGQAVVDAIGQVPVDPSDKPLSPVVMESVTVEEQ
ncbi:MAG: peptidylprolyl isomerase [bacterium]|nr:peptidylprolyl isomerase [bacterium]